MGEKFIIDNQIIENAKSIAAKIEDKNIRKRAYALAIGAISVSEFLSSEGIDIKTKLSLFRVPSVAKSIEIADIYFGDARLDVRVTFNDETFSIPKTHEKYSATPDAYIVLKLDSSLNNAEILGFINPKEIEYPDSNFEYYTLSTNILKPISELRIFLTSLKLKMMPFSSEENDKIKELAAAFIDEEITESEKVYFIKHVVACAACRESLCELNEFDTIVSQMKNHEDLLNDSTLNILTGNPKAAEKNTENNFPIKEENETAVLIPPLVEAPPVLPAPPIVLDTPSITQEISEESINEIDTKETTLDNLVSNEELEPSETETEENLESETEIELLEENELLEEPQPEEDAIEPENDIETIYEDINDSKEDETKENSVETDEIVSEVPDLELISDDTEETENIEELNPADTDIIKEETDSLENISEETETELENEETPNIEDSEPMLLEEGEANANTTETDETISEVPDLELISDDTEETENIEELNPADTDIIKEETDSLENISEETETELENEETLNIEDSEPMLLEEDEALILHEDSDKEEVLENLEPKQEDNLAELVNKTDNDLTENQEDNIIHENESSELELEDLETLDSLGNLEELHENAEPLEELSEIIEEHEDIEQNETEQQETVAEQSSEPSEFATIMENSEENTENDLLALNNDEEIGALGELEEIKELDQEHDDTSLINSTEKESSQNSFLLDEVADEKAQTESLEDLSANNESLTEETEEEMTIQEQENIVDNLQETNDDNIQEIKADEELTYENNEALENSFMQEPVELNYDDEIGINQEAQNSTEQQEPNQEANTVDAEIQGLLDDDLLALLSDNDDESTTQTAQDFTHYVEENQAEDSDMQENFEQNLINETQSVETDEINQEVEPQNESTENIETLFDKTTENAEAGDENNVIDVDEEPISEATANAAKKLIIGGALLVLLAGGAGAAWFMNHSKAVNDNTDMLDATNQSDSLFDFENKGKDENNEGPAVSQDINKSMANSFSDKPAAITITKISWQVSEKLATEPSVKEYLQTAGKNIQMNLQNDLANSADVTFNPSIKVSFEIAPDNTMKGMQVLESSGSDKIDETVLRSIKNTLKYVSVPKLKDFKSDYFLTIVINF